jgi:hypothetical protein
MRAPSPEVAISITWTRNLKRVIDTARPVRVFRNWKRGCWSIMQDGMLRASARQVRLADVDFLVRASGRERMLREGRKNVHAYAVGTLLDWVHPDDARELDALDGRTLVYDAYRWGSFVDRDSQAAVHESPAVRLHEAGVTYVPEILPVAA